MKPIFTNSTLCAVNFNHGMPLGIGHKSFVLALEEVCVIVEWVIMCLQIFRPIEIHVLVTIAIFLGLKELKRRVNDFLAILIKPYLLQIRRLRNWLKHLIVIRASEEENADANVVCLVFGRSHNPMNRGLEKTSGKELQSFSYIDNKAVRYILRLRYQEFGCRFEYTHPWNAHLNPLPAISLVENLKRRDGLRK